MEDSVAIQKNLKAHGSSLSGGANAILCFDVTRQKLVPNNPQRAFSNLLKFALVENNVLLPTPCES